MNSHSNSKDASTYYFQTYFFKDGTIIYYSSSNNATSNNSSWKGQLIYDTTAKTWYEYYDTEKINDSYSVADGYKKTYDEFIAQLQNNSYMKEVN